MECANNIFSLGSFPLRPVSLVSGCQEHKHLWAQTVAQAMARSYMDGGASSSGLEEVWVLPWKGEVSQSRAG